MIEGEDLLLHLRRDIWKWNEASRGQVRGGEGAEWDGAGGQGIVVLKKGCCKGLWDGVGE